MIKTERLILRHFEEKDIGALYQILSDEEVNTFLPWYPVENINEAKKIFEKRYSQNKPQNKFYYAICLKENNVPIGYIKADMMDNYDFGYALLKEYWHKGIMTEAGIALIEVLKKEGIPFITATHDKNNPRSGEVMRNIGMKYCYSYEELWQPKNFSVIFRMYQLNFKENDNKIYKKYWKQSKNHFVEKNLYK